MNPIINRRSHYQVSTKERWMLRSSDLHIGSSFLRFQVETVTKLESSGAMDMLLHGFDSKLSTSSTISAHRRPSA